MLFSVVGIYVCKKNFAIQSAGILILCYNCLEIFWFILVIFTILIESF